MLQELRRGDTRAQKPTQKYTTPQFRYRLEWRNANDSKKLEKGQRKRALRDELRCANRRLKTETADTEGQIMQERERVVLNASVWEIPAYVDKRVQETEDLGRAVHRRACGRE